MLTMPEAKETIRPAAPDKSLRMNLVSTDCATKTVSCFFVVVMLSCCIYIFLQYYKISITGNFRIHSYHSN